MDSVILTVCAALGGLLSALCCYWGIYTVVGLFKTRVFPKTDKQHKYAIVIAARNEEKVLGKLLESIRRQDYPKELLEVFVVADNCTDATADIARENGAICYERFDTEHHTKGYALQFLFERIRRDFGIESFAGYIVFDADNLLKSDYISRMNEAYDAGERVITSYRNTKNFGENWIAASYGLHWLRTVRVEHRARSLFRMATRIQGTGLLVGSELLKNGWNYTCLTEDRELSAEAVLAGYSVSYCDAAEFYDEQPTSLPIAFRQRNRWSKGHLQVIRKASGKLFRHIFTARDIGEAFMTYDMFFIVFPRSLVRVLLDAVKLLVPLCVWLFTSAQFGVFGAALLSWLTAFAGRYAANIAAAAYVFLSERRRIPAMAWYKKVFYTLTFPIFDIIGRISMVIALFMKVEWKPIPHRYDATIDDMRQLPR